MYSISKQFHIDNNYDNGKCDNTITSDGKIEITLEKVKEEDDKEKEFVSVKIKDNEKIF